MSSTITFQALSGVIDESPPCYILQVNNTIILLDCGLDKNCNLELLDKLKKHVPAIDAVLISHPDVEHLGVLPYLVITLGLNCPIYATVPVYTMGQMFMYDFHQSHDIEDFNLFTLDDIDTAFNQINQVQFNQTIPINGKCSGITITALRAGHTIGGTMWKISINGNEDIIYANDFNHKKDRHVDGCNFGNLQRPSLMILGATKASSPETPRKLRDEQLLRNILETLSKNGNVLIPADSAGRVLELAYMLNQLWDSCQSYLLDFSLVLLNNVSYSVVKYAKSHIEWMSDEILKKIENAQGNPFRLKHVRICHNMEELHNISNCKVVLASSADMDSGFAREVFLEWCSDFNNRIIITSKSLPGSLARDLVDNIIKGTVDLVIKKRVQLEGVELEEYMKKSSKMKNSYKRCHMESSDSDDNDDSAMMKNIVKKINHNIISNNTETSLFSHLMFPYHEDVVEWDEYGIKINLDLYRENNTEVVNIEQKKPKEEEFDVSTIPTKRVSINCRVEVNACVEYIDFEGRSDGNSIIQILSQLNPRKVIIVKGNPEDTSLIEKQCQHSLTSQVFAPSRGQVIDIISDTPMLHSILTDALLSEIKFHKIGNAEVAWIDGQISNGEKYRNMQCLGAADEPMKVDDDVLVLEPIANTAVQPHVTGFASNLKLSNFKQLLVKNHILAKFSDGVLMCSDNTIAIQRLENGQLHMQGCLSEDYYKVRSLLYEYNAIL